MTKDSERLKKMPRKKKKQNHVEFQEKCDLELKNNMMITLMHNLDISETIME